MVEHGYDPYTELHIKLSEIVANTLGEDAQIVSWLITTPSRREYGDLSIPLMRFARKSGKSVVDLYQVINKQVEESKLEVSETVLTRGYMNFKLDIPRITEKLSKLLSSGWIVRLPKAKAPRRIVVEHTSANPIHPLHMGHARNTSIGDTLARMLKARGHLVNRRFYVDDVGKQVAIAAYGFRILGVNPAEESRMLGVKPDHFVGWVYAVTFSSIEAVELKRELDQITGGEERSRKQVKLDDIMAALASLKERDPGSYFDRILAHVTAAKDNEAEIQEIMARYEKGLEPEKSLIRSVVYTVLEGFRESLLRVGVEFDDWDWESDMVWSSRVGRIIDEAKRSKYYIRYKDADAINIPLIIEEILSRDEEAKRRIRLPKGVEIPPLILVRSDGTTLYTTRDMAYTLYKFEQFKADRVVNVIGADQRLAQLQLRLALLGLGYRREALNLIHYDYEMVRLPGLRMSGRRGRFIDMDSILDSLTLRAEEEVRKRNPRAGQDWVRRVAEQIAVGALRFTLIRTSANRPVVFDPDKVLNLEENTGPYLQYTHARACGIMNKHGEINYNAVNYDACGVEPRRHLLLEAMRYPVVAAKAADDMAPEDLAVYLLKLADEFNSWYQVDPVIREPDEGVRECKALIVEYFRQSLRHGLGLLGIPAPERM